MHLTQRRSPFRWSYQMIETYLENDEGHIEDKGGYENKTDWLAMVSRLPIL